jgi:hypothetical protein
VIDIRREIIFFGGVIVIQRRCSALRRRLWSMRNFFICRSIPNFIIIPGLGLKESGDRDVILYKV